MIDWTQVRDPNFREVPPRLSTMALLLGIAGFALAWATRADYGIASDVANYFTSSLMQMNWFGEFFQGVLDGQPARALGPDRMDETWRWYLERMPHPPLSRELGGLTWTLGHRFTDPLTAYRLAVMLAFGGLVSWVTVFTKWALGSRLAGLIAGLAVLSYPVLFAHAHLAHTDLFLATFWFGGAAAIVVYERTRGLGWLFGAGVLLGAAAATKFSGLLLAPVFVAWLLARRPREVAPALFVIGLVAAAVFIAANPLIWVSPEVALSDYFGAGTTRADGEMTRLRTLYFGTIYEFRPPFHYPWVWTLIVVPPTFLLAAAVALLRIRRGWLVPFCLLNMGVLYAALLLPSAPMHDGVRLFLPVLPFQCVLVGYGAHHAIEFLSERWPAVGRPWFEALVAVAVIAPVAAGTVRTHPYQLSYANSLIGGTDGLEARGLEVTNLKEVFSPRVLADLRELIPQDAIVDPGFMTEEMCYYQAMGYAPRWAVETQLTTAAGEPGDTLTCRGGSVLVSVVDRPARDPDFVFILNRKAVWRPVDRALFEHGGSPSYEISLDGVPLFRVYRVR